MYTPQIIVDEFAPISSYEVAVNRISTDVAEEAVDLAKNLLGDNGENIPEISNSISFAFEEFIEYNPDGFPEDFADYLLGAPTTAAAEALEYVHGLGVLFEKIGSMGITETELSISRRNILSRLKVDGLRGREMIEFFDSFVLANEQN